MTIPRANARMCVRCGGPMIGEPKSRDMCTDCRANRSRALGNSDQTLSMAALEITEAPTRWGLDAIQARIRRDEASHTADPIVWLFQVNQQKLPTGLFPVRKPFSEARELSTAGCWRYRVAAAGERQVDAFDKYVEMSGGKWRWRVTADEAVAA
jgi:hypothetical protein